MTTYVTDNSIASLCDKVGAALTKRGLLLATAESCTGGWLAKAVTDLPGSSGWFERGFVTYSNTSKIEMLDVRAVILETCGAVSEQAVIEMAAGALAHSRADLAVAISGVAGPDGGTQGKPVGTVWLACMRRGRAAVATHHLYAGDRASIRRQAVADALRGVLEVAGD